MPVKSSDSSVLVWPKKSEVIRALQQWEKGLRESRSDLVRVGYYGSLARDDWGVGSDVDLVVILDRADRPPIERPLEFDLSPLPVATDLLVFTADEWDARITAKDRFAEEMRRVIWI
jgi:uncharacterized protein